MKKQILMIITAGAVAMGTVLFNGCGSSEEKTNTETHEHSEGHVHEHNAYFCPMKCEGEKTYADPGACPKCGMDMVKVSSESEGKSENMDKVQYACPMHPEITSTEEGKCSECGMDLVLVEEESHEGHEH